MAFWKSCAAALLLVCGGAAYAQSRTPEQIRDRAQHRRAAERDLARWSTNRLTPFRGENDFRAYVQALRKLDTVRWARSRRDSIQLAQATPPTQSDTPPDLCAPEDKLCQGRRLQDETVVVTGAIYSTPLTNNQEAGVDEGDVVKQIGQYLLVLHDGRIFVADTEAGADRRTLTLTDRANVYRDSREDAWYDELVVYGDRVVVTGYSYRREATEIAIFRLEAGGRLQRQAVFQIRGFDYYDRNNYASRLIGDRLILYTPVPIETYEERPFRWPTLERVDAPSAGGRTTQLLRPEQLYRPLARADAPVIHMVTSCSIGRAGADKLDCVSDGFIAPGSRQFYVSGHEAYLWTAAPDDLADDDYSNLPACPVRDHVSRQRAQGAIVYRLNLASRDLAVAGARGFPFDQLGMDASNGQFRALVGWLPPNCEVGDAIPLTFVNLDAADFSRRLRAAEDDAFTPMPDIGVRLVENRFTDRFLVFGGRRDDDYGDSPERNVGGGDIVVVPLDAPDRARRISLPHRVWRVERVGNNVGLTGYSDQSGLFLSIIDLGGNGPRVVGRAHLEWRFESEGRSHAFNSLVGEDGSGLLGLPTILHRDEADRWAWWSQPSDLSFLAMDSAGRLSPLGELKSRYDRDARPEGYECEVSCIDWYGNARLLFTHDRVFALTATELVEGRIGAGRISELQRLDLTGPIRAATLPADPGE